MAGDGAGGLVVVWGYRARVEHKKTVHLFFFGGSGMTTGIATELMNAPDEVKAQQKNHAKMVLDFMKEKSSRDPKVAFEREIMLHPKTPYGQCQACGSILTSSGYCYDCKK